MKQFFGGGRSLAFIIHRARSAWAWIPTKDLGRIFERFYRVDRAGSRVTAGTGLGLSIVRHIVERHRGRVRASSELRKGSEFTTLPLL